MMQLFRAQPTVRNGVANKEKYNEEAEWAERPCIGNLQTRFSSL